MGLLRGLGAAAPGMRAAQARMDVLANNLANAATTGYQRDTALSVSFDDMLLRRFFDGAPPAAPVGPLSAGVQLQATAARLTGGPLRYTGGPLDVAIHGDGFFTVQTPQGVRYTRAGDFTQDAQGRLTTPAGDLVLAGGQPLAAPNIGMSIAEDGTVSAGGQALGRLDVVSAADLGALRKEGNNLWAPAGQGQVSGLILPQARGQALRVGFLEGSNVEPALEMVNLIETMRAYEADQKAVQAHDQALARAVQEVGQG